MSGSDSSSEEEDRRRIREAVWTCDGVGVKNTLTSKRTEPVEHQHDGNELKTTPEFRSFISKKLTTLLDRRISEVRCETAEGSREERETYEERDDFRLFSTSLPGNWQEEPTLTLPPRRRPAPSSSDSDSEMEERLKAAAVSLSDLFPSVPSMHQEGGTINSNEERLSADERNGEKSFLSGHEAEHQEQRRVEGHGSGDDVVKKKKKRKKKKRQ